jgi:hypothetical protein
LLVNLQKAQADLQTSFKIQKGLTQEAWVRELTADAAQSALSVPGALPFRTAQ